MPEHERKKCGEGQRPTAREGPQLAKRVSPPRCALHALGFHFVTQAQRPLVRI